jgi:hypothetical protein
LTFVLETVAQDLNLHGLAFVPAGEDGAAHSIPGPASQEENSNHAEVGAALPAALACLPGPKIRNAVAIRPNPSRQRSPKFSGIVCKYRFGPSLNLVNPISS